MAALLQFLLVYLTFTKQLETNISQVINGKYFTVIVGVIIGIKPIAQNIDFESIEMSQTQTMEITLIVTVYV